MFLLGSFTDGMFKGAQSAMSMYTGIQGILAAQDSAAMSKKVEEQRQKELSDQKGMTQADTAIGELQASRAPPAAPATTPTVPGGDQPMGPPATKVAAPAPKPADTTATPSGITTAGGDAAERERDAARAADAARIAQAAAPLTASQIYGNAGALPVTPTSQLYGNAGSLPAASPTSIYGGVPAIAPAQAPMTSEAPAGIPPARTPGLTSPPTYQPATYSPFGAAASAPPSPPSVTQPVGGYFTGQNPAGTIPATSGRPAVIPPPQTPPASALPTAGGAPGAGGPVPQAAISPAPTAGAGVGARFSSLLSQVNPVGTAHAEPAAGDVNAPQPGQGAAAYKERVDAAPGGNQPMGAPAPASGSPIADATIQGAPAPGQPGAPAPQPAAPAAAPAVPAKPDPSGKVTPGPVTVKTAEGQTVTQSETPTISMAPPVSGWYGQELERRDPGLARLTHQLVDQLGANAVTYDQVAAHMYRESRFKSGVTGPFGEHGVMQVMPDTQAWLERNILHRHVDQNSPEGGLTLGITYLRYLANDLHLGGNTLQTNLAYMRGPGAVNQINKIGLEASQRGEGQYNLKNALGWLDDMYRTGGPGSDSAIKLDKNQFQGGALSENHVQVTPQGAMQAAASGPEGTLNYIASTGSPGLGMSELWIQYQGALERQAIWSGHLDMLPHIADFVLQQSHQGALSNLAAADAALASGNMQGAASAIARAHAFFPDGSYAQIGVDGKGNLYGQQFSENTHQPLGKPMAITRDMIQSQMMALGNPHDYVKTLDAHRKINSDIDYQKAHGDYFRSLPGIKEAQEEGRNQRAADAAAAKEHEAELKRQQAITLRETQEKNTGDLDKELNGKYDINSKPPEVSSQDWANRSEIERQIRLPNSMGGAHMGGATGAAIAEGMTTVDPATKQPAIRMVPMHDKEDPKKQIGWAIVDNKGQVRATLGMPAGQHILQLPGMTARNPMSQQPPANPQKQALNIGSGMGSQQAQQQGLNQNLAGVPTIPQASPQLAALS